MFLNSEDNIPMIITYNISKEYNNACSNVG